MLLAFLFTGCLLQPAGRAAFAGDSREHEAFFVAKRAFEDGFYEVSLDLLERFLKNYPASEKQAEANLLIGQCYYHQNRFLDSMAKFEELLKQPYARNIRDACLYWIAEVHFRGNAFDKAGQYYRMVVDEYPKSVYAVYSHYSLGLSLFQGAKFDEAVKSFQAVEEKFPNDPLAQDSSFEIIESLYYLKDYDRLKAKAALHLEKYPRDGSKPAYIYFYLAEANYYTNDFAAASEVYAKALSSTGDLRMQALSKLGLGWACLKSRQYQKAEAAFSEVSEDGLEKKSLDVLLLGKAILMSETGRFLEARDVYGKVLNTTQDPVVAIQALLGQAEALYNSAEYKAAIDSYKQAQGRLAAGMPQDVADKLHYGLAWVYLKEGNFKEAIEEFRKIVKNTEDKIVKVSALCQIGDAYQDAGDYGKAIQAYDEILKDYRDSFYADYVQYQLGLSLLKSSNYNGAILAFQALRANFPGSKLSDDASYAMGLAYFQQQDYSSSRDIFEKFPLEFKDSPLKADCANLLGTSLYNLGEFSRAIEVFKHITAAYSQDASLTQRAEYQIADCYYRMGDENEAMSRFKALRSKYPDSSLAPEVMWWLGEYYYRHNDINVARRYFSSLIRDFPDSNLVADAYYVMGSISHEEAKYEEAMSNFNKVMELGKSDLAGQAAIAVADIYIKQNQADLAQKTYEQVALEHENLRHLVYPKAAELYAKAGDYERALEFYGKSLEIVPVKEMSRIQFKIAEVRQAQGKLPEAMEEYLKVSYLYSDNSELAVKALLRIGGILEDREDFKGALGVYKKIASMGVQEAKYAQERIDWINAHIKK